MENWSSIWPRTGISCPGANFTLLTCFGVVSCEMFPQEDFKSS